MMQLKSVSFVLVFSKSSTWIQYTYGTCKLHMVKYSEKEDPFSSWTVVAIGGRAR